MLFSHLIQYINTAQYDTFIGSPLSEQQEEAISKFMLGNISEDVMFQLIQKIEAQPGEQCHSTSFIIF